MSPPRGKRILVLSNLYPPNVVGGYEAECAGAVENLRRENDVLVLTSKYGSRRRSEEPGVARLLDFLPYRRRTLLFSPIYALRAARATRRLLREFRPDVVYIWNGSQIPQVAIRLLELSGAPVAYRVCEHWFGLMYEDDGFMRGLRGGRLGPLMRAINALLPPLRVDATRQVEAGISWCTETMQRITPVPGTVRPSVERVTVCATQQGEAFAELDRRPDPECTVGFIGRVSREKGVDVAIDAIAELRDRRGVEARFVVAGTGEATLMRDLETQAERLGLADRVRFAGKLDTAQLSRLLPTLHALVVPSTWEEPAGIVLVEGALARVPLVASRVGGIPDIVRDGEEALLCPAGDPEALAEALWRTVSLPEETEARVRRAFARAQGFRIGPHDEALAEFLETTIEVAGNGGG